MKVLDFSCRSISARLTGSLLLRKAHLQEREKALIRIHHKHQLLHFYLFSTHVNRYFKRNSSFLLNQTRTEQIRKILVPTQNIIYSKRTTLKILFNSYYFAPYYIIWEQNHPFKRVRFFNPMSTNCVQTKNDFCSRF